MKQIILLGGAPTTGKTTLAKKLSKEYNCPWISTDFIRSWMKSIVLKKRFPHLFNFNNLTAEEHYKKYSIDETIALEKLRDKEVFKGIKEFIKINNDWDRFIIEGISIHPEFIKELSSNDYEVFPIFLIEKNKKRIKKFLYKRGLWDDAHKYEDWVKEIELEELVKTNLYYANECRLLNLPFIEIKEDYNETINEII
ncbi:MAG: hypothetical protein PF542_04335, partial [Nanoarchaeota archaeon]|nr:hypothetical protein [Nanoarchaeota archaeon]